MMARLLVSVRILTLVASLVLTAFLSACGSSKAGPGKYCDKTSDCQAGLECKSHTCQKPDPGQCVPACKPDVEACINGTCRPIADPNDKDGDGFQTGADCNDMNPYINPAAYEYCDGVDNNCNNQVDEGCPNCNEGAVQPCGTDMGDCVAGMQTCTGGAWGACTGTGPILESCDGHDNDCDGLVDEVCPCQSGQQVPCSSNVGTCIEGVQTCEEGMWSACRNGEIPRPEVCDGRDNDCDGLTDNGFSTGSTCQGVGECGAGARECAGDFETICSTMPGGSQDHSETEKCDHLDNDCDGLTDEGLEADTVPNSCQIAKDLGGLPDDGSEIKVTGNLWPDNDEDWYKVTATDDGQADATTLCDRFHFRVRFLARVENMVVDVYVDGCDGAHVDCLSDTAYDHAYDGRWNETTTPIGQCECRNESVPGYNLCLSEPRVFYIRVHGGSGHVFGCENYQLSISNGLITP